jgi:hypothetical protein
MMDCEVKVESNGYVSIFVGLNLECKQKERESSERRTLMSGGKDASASGTSGQVQVVTMRPEWCGLGRVRRKVSKYSGEVAVWCIRRK